MIRLLNKREIETTQTYLHDFHNLENGLPGHRLKQIRQQRRKAMANFIRHGYPARRQEEWKYTDVSPLARQHFRPATMNISNNEIAALISSLPIDVDATRMVFVDGYYQPSLSQQSPQPQQVIVHSLADVLNQDSLTLEATEIELSIQQYEPHHRHGLVELNIALMTDGAYIKLPPGSHTEQSIHLIFVSSGKEEHRLSSIRNLVIAAENTQARIVEHYLSAHDTPQLTNTITHIVMGKQSVIEHVRLAQENKQSYHFSGLSVQQAQNSHFSAHNFTTGGKLVRHDIHVTLDGTGSECRINGLYVGHGRQHMDNHILIEHVAPQATSRQYYKGILDGHSQGIFNGQVIVHQHAQRSDARQTNHNLLLSNHAEAYTQPRLEIYADNVSCSHGATVGQLDQEALFYLRSRAIDEQQARSILITAFAGDVLKHIQQTSLRHYMDDLLAEKLRYYNSHEKKVA